MNYLKPGLLLLLVTTISVTAGPATAQPDPCDLELTTFGQLAAEGAVSGDAALQTVAGLLDEIAAGCPASTIDLPGGRATYTAPNETFSLDYPADWAVGNFQSRLDGGLIFLGSNRLAAIMIERSQPDLRGDEAGIGVVVTPASAITRGVTGVEGIEIILAGLRRGLASQYAVQGDPELLTSADQTVGRIVFIGEDFEAALLTRALPDGERFALVTAFAAPGRLAEVEALASAVAQTIR
ncbi:MAG: hypothetical protein GYB67_02785 [Chloroflexi bacterium]|nr:hypothetical protein [Chloroflexota bacterium]